jgi:hypothetical protein
VRPRLVRYARRLCLMSRLMLLVCVVSWARVSVFSGRAVSAL